MCGIAGSFTGEREVRAGLAALRHRGPDAEGVASVGRLTLGHVRLAVLDPDPRSDQPIHRGRVTLSYSGEVWNFREVRAELKALGEHFATAGDTEVVAAALDRWGPEALPRLNGMFALAWTTGGETLHLARDRFGEVPLHIALQRPFLFASELKGLEAMGARRRSFADLGPGWRAEVTATGIRKVRWYDVPARPAVLGRDTARQRLFQLLRAAVTERAVADVPVCTLLSGGIDSAAVAFFLSRAVKGLVAYTAVLNPRSPDLRSAREVADHLGIELRTVRIRPPAPEDLIRVVRCIEMPHKAQVEIGWACLALAERMRADGFKVTFSGEGSDELWASYGFAYYGLRQEGWYAYRKSLFLDQARKNFPRANKAFMASGVECRLPFLNPRVVEFALSLPRPVVQEGKCRPKAVLQDAFAGRLPPYVLRRPKVAFQDGLGLKAAIAAKLPAPQRFYRAEYAKAFGVGGAGARV
jgi:asparagine synthase (glutamine-hydrolysing)